MILISQLLENPTFDKLSDKANFELQTNQPELAENTLLQIVLQDSFNIENHYSYILAHFDIVKNRDDNPIRMFYDSLAQSADSRLADIGFYGKGLIQANFDKYHSAISEFLQVNDKKLKYLNNSIGNAYKQIDSVHLAEQYFKAEIENRGNLDGAYWSLIQLLFEQGRTNELNDCLKNEEVKKYFPSEVERAMYFQSFQPVKYEVILFKRIFSGFNIWGAIAALLIMGSWIMYLRKLDIFEIEKWKHVIITALMGMAFSFLVFPLSDFNNLILDFKLNGGLINDFFYCVVGIGAIEEFVKIVPLLLMMRFTKAVNEPFDYIQYASLSALGFAFVENLIYFDEHSLYIIHGRALTAVVFHMFASSIIAYGIILNKYKRHKNPYLNFLLFFAMASVSHGFYDFWLINESVGTFRFLTMIFLFSSVYMWNSFKNNALNHSDFYDKDKSIDDKKLQDYLFYSLAGVLLFEYVALAFKFGPSVAGIGLAASFYSGTYLIIFLSTNLGKFLIVKGRWAPIQYRPIKRINYEKIIGVEIQLSPFTNDDFAFEYLPNSGKVFRRLTVSAEPDWYLAKLNASKQLNPYLADTVLIRTKERDEQIEKGKKKLVAFCLIPADTNLDRGDLKQTDFKFCGWATAE